MQGCFLQVGRKRVTTTNLCGMPQGTKGKGPAVRSSPSAGGSSATDATMSVVEKGVYKPNIGQRFRIPSTAFQDPGQAEGPMTDRFPDALDWRDQFLYATKVGDRNGSFGLKFDGDRSPWYDQDKSNREFWRQFEYNPISQSAEDTPDPAQTPAPRRPSGSRISQNRSPAPNCHRISRQLGEIEENADSDDGSTEAEWESGHSSDGGRDLPSDCEREEDEHHIDNVLEGITWASRSRVRQDVRVPEYEPAKFVPQVNLPGDPNSHAVWDFFLLWMSLDIVDAILTATNAAANKIKWSKNRSWRKLSRGRLFRFLGVLVLMSLHHGVTPHRQFWRGPLKFGKYMTEIEFENIKRAFTLPQYLPGSPNWNGPAPSHHEDGTTRHDRSFKTRRFWDMINALWAVAIVPGPHLCLDESMFVWLGLPLKFPGWKVMKCKPHPFGLELKTLACAATKIVLWMEPQEGKEQMKHFPHIDKANKSTGWCLRATEKWWGTHRTLIADSAFGQVRAAASLLLCGLFCIFNIKSCHKYFPKKNLKEETGPEVGAVLVKEAVVEHDGLRMIMWATGWRCTRDMVVTYLSTCSTSLVGKPKIKNKYSLKKSGVTIKQEYAVVRPVVSAEYQHEMGAIDTDNKDRHRFYLMITHSPTFRFFLNVLLMVVVNVVNALLFFCPGKFSGCSKYEMQEKVAVALINNPFIPEDQSALDSGNEADDDDEEGDGKFVKGPKQGKCMHCSRTSKYRCRECSKPVTTTVKHKKASGKGGRVKRGSTTRVTGQCWVCTRCQAIPNKHVCSKFHKRKRTRASADDDDEVDVVVPV